MPMQVWPMPWLALGTISPIEQYAGSNWLRVSNERPCNLLAKVARVFPETSTIHGVWIFRGYVAVRVHVRKGRTICDGWLRPHGRACGLRSQTWVQGAPAHAE